MKLNQSFEWIVLAEEILWSQATGVTPVVTSVANFHTKKQTINCWSLFSRSCVDKGCSKNTVVINRPCIVTAVLQTYPSFGDWVSNPFPTNLQNTINPKPLELARDLNFIYTIFITCHVSCVTCHCVTYQIGGASRWKVCYQRGLPLPAFRVIKQLITCLSNA